MNFRVLQHCLSLFVLTHNFQSKSRGHGLLAIDLQHNIFSLAAEDAIIFEACGIKDQLGLRVIGAILLLELSKQITWNYLNHKLILNYSQPWCVFQ